MNKIAIIILALLLSSCTSLFPKDNNKEDKIQDVMEACYWLGQLDYHRGIIKIDTTTYQLKYSIFGENNPPKFWYGGSHFGKVMKEKFEAELNKNK